MDKVSNQSGQLSGSARARWGSHSARPQVHSPCTETRPVLVPPGMEPPCPRPAPQPPIGNSQRTGVRSIMTSVKRHPRMVSSTPGTSGYRHSCKRVLRVRVLRVTQKSPPDRVYVNGGYDITLGRHHRRYRTHRRGTSCRSRRWRPPPSDGSSPGVSCIRVEDI